MRSPSRAQATAAFEELPPAATVADTSQDTLAPNGSTRRRPSGPDLHRHRLVLQRQVLVDGDVTDEHDVESLTLAFRFRARILLVGRPPLSRARE